MSHHHRALVINGPSAIDETIYLLSRKRGGIPAVWLWGWDNINVGQQQVWHQVGLRSPQPEQVAVVGHQFMMNQAWRENCWKGWQNKKNKYRYLYVLVFFKLLKVFFFYIRPRVHTLNHFACEFWIVGWRENVNHQTFEKILVASKGCLWHLLIVSLLETLTQAFLRCVYPNKAKQLREWVKPCLL